MDDGGTLGALMRHHMTMTATCEACRHYGRVDLARLAARLGADWSYLGRVPPSLVCSACGSQAVTITIGGSRAPSDGAVSSWGMMPASLTLDDLDDKE